MDIRLDDPEKVLDNMKSCIDKYARAAKKRRGMTPYISAYCMDYNPVRIGVRNNVEDELKIDSKRELLVVAHYGPGEPSYTRAQNWSETDLMDAIWVAELGAYEKYAIQKHSAELLRPCKLIHGEGASRIVRPEFKNFSDIKVDDVRNWLADIDSAMKNTYKDVFDTCANMDFVPGNDIFYDSLENQIIQHHSRMTVGMYAAARADDMPMRRIILMDRIGGFGGAELLDKYKSEAIKKAKRIAEKSVLFAKAKKSYKDFKLVSGQYEAVFDGKVAGVAMHEVGAGHMAEANNLVFFKDDEIETTTPFEGREGKKLAIDDLNLIDYGMLEINGEKPFSWYEYDAEGVRAKKTKIIDYGKFNSYLHSKFTAGTLPKKYGGGFLTGNARVEGPADSEGNPNRPVPRMSTLFIEPSRKHHSIDDLLYSIAGKGLYFAGMSSGQVENSSQGRVNFQEIYYVAKGGSKGYSLIPLRIPGHKMFIIDDAIGFMGKIDAVGDKSTVQIDSGWCGASSGFIPHSASGAALKLHNVHLITKLDERPYKKPLVNFF